MENIIVYVDDAAYAMQMLQGMRADGAARNPTRWIVVGCAPRVTHRVSKWVTHSARELGIPRACRCSLARNSRIDERSTARPSPDRE